MNKTLLSCSRCFLLTLWFTGFGAAAVADEHADLMVVNVDLQPGPTGDGDAVQFSGQGDYSDPGNNTWNVVAPPTDGSYNSGAGTGGKWTSNLTSGALVDSSGAATSVTVTLTADATNTNVFALKSTHHTWPDIADDAKDLMCDYFIAAEHSTQSISIDNLGSGVYDLYLYGVSNKTGADTKFTIGGVSKSTAGLPGGAHNLTEGDDYVVFTNLTPTAGSIVITYEEGDSTSANWHGHFNGFQLVEVPEPSD